MRSLFTTHLLLCCWLLLPASAFASSGDSLLLKRKAAPQSQHITYDLRMKQREVRNYIRPTLSFSIFNTGSRSVKGSVPAITARLGNYKYFQSSLSFYTPLYTRTKFRGTDSTEVRTFHLLFTVNTLTDRPAFSRLEKQHELYKLAIGVRGIWTWKSRCVFFADVTPFITGDKYNGQSTSRLRMGSTFVFNYMVSPEFSFRLGLTKTFIYGNKLYLPMIGFRVGRLDGPVYFQLQFPRHASLTVQPSPKVSVSFYSKAYGGLYNISNGDSLYPGTDSVIQFGHLGIANGVRVEIRPGPNFNFFFGGGLASRNFIWLYSYDYNQVNNLNPLAPFYKGKPTGTIFLQAGLTVRFGKAKRSQGNYLMYDVFDLNNTMDPGDNNNNPGNGEIRPGAKAEEMQKVQYKDVEDLVDETDLY
jgi:hypothetical protein